MYNLELFVALGHKLKEDNARLEEVIATSLSENSWFTRDNILFAIEAITLKMTNKEALSVWLKKYSPPLTVKNVGIIMAGNIPLAGFFDMLCVLISGHRCYVKPSSKDSALVRYVIELLSSDFVIETLVDDSPIDAIIATGSNNTNRYFESRYSGIPHLLRRSRTSVAIIADADKIDGLAQDVFTYFGMGCRNVSKIFIPEGYDVMKLRNTLATKNISFAKYLNIYRHHKAVLEMRGEKFIDGGFFTLRESRGESENLADIVYERYNSVEQVQQWLALNDDTIQCVVTNLFAHPRRADIGRAQFPELWDYPDGADVMAFLSGV